jgi:hypothetical protein
VANHQVADPSNVLGVKSDSTSECVLILKLDDTYGWLGENQEVRGNRHFHDSECPVEFRNQRSSQLDP